jgi:hypothetical protein
MRGSRSSKVGQSVSVTKPLWRCPECGRPFANARQPHSCGRVSVESHLAGRTEHLVVLYTRFEEMVRACGPVVIVPAKTRIGFQVRMIFAAVNAFRADGFEAHVVLARRLEHPRFRRIESLSPRNHVHHFSIRSLDELDDDVQAWLDEAYKVGEQKHLGSSARG